MTPDPTSEPTPVRIEVCPKHGLRYNAAVDDGCARCRTETGARAVASGAGATRRAPDLGRSLLVAGLLVVGVGGSLYGAHVLAYKAGRAVFEQTLEEVSDTPVESDEELEEVLDEILGDG